MICTYCGANNADTAHFCEKCGKQFETNEPTQLSAPSPSSENTSPSPPSEQQGPFYAAPSFPQPNATDYGAFPSYETAEPIYAPPPPPPYGVHSPGLTSPYEPLPPRLVRRQQIRPRLWITMAIIVVVLLAGIGGYAYSNRSTPMKTLQAACDTSKSADWQASYDLLSSDFQRQLGSERQYAAAAGQFNGSRGGVVDCTISSLTENGSSASAVVQTTYGDRSTAIIDFALVDENSVWKIRNFAFRQ